MCSLEFLLLAISVVKAFINPVGNELISRSLEEPNCTCPLQAQQACPGHCESGWTYFRKTDACFKVFYWEDFDVAESICDMKGGHLASIHSFEENEFVIELAKTGVKGDNYLKGTWIGLKQANYPLSMEWSWTDGTKVDYTPWSPGQPNDNKGVCAQVFCDYMVDESLVYRKWNDTKCSDKMRTFLCKKAALH
ncbi:unnamed protein product [Cylicocyclus nassatus]|uniref:C-type lectin domain-containing protein n=1 Tax=Cylicocyclus nassatus TaxID=53992 RepID=A0AA36M7R8_CYLNA|nr:unnamed protein product [Cylicocyclus nassatus]